MSGGWSTKGYIEVSINGVVCISVVFSWLLDMAVRRRDGLLASGVPCRVGGPAARVAGTSYDDMDMLHLHNSSATFTTRGCVRSCPFCAVPIIEGGFRELSNWNPAPIVCDNNLLASSRRHFDRVVDCLKPLAGVDFNQGLDARLLNGYHAGRLAELRLAKVRLAWDTASLEAPVAVAVNRLLSAGFPKNRITVYVLIGFRDSPDDALYRLESLRRWGVVPFPMRYQPIDCRRRNEYVAPGWSNNELVRFQRYWSNLRYTGAVPFPDFRYPSPPVHQRVGGKYHGYGMSA